MPDFSYLQYNLQMTEHSSWPDKIKYCSQGNQEVQEITEWVISGNSSYGSDKLRSSEMVLPQKHLQRIQLLAHCNCHFHCGENYIHCHEPLNVLDSVRDYISQLC